MMETDEKAGEQKVYRPAGRWLDVAVQLALGVVIAILLALCTHN